MLDLAGLAGVSQGLIYKLETAECGDDLGHMYITSLLRVSGALGVPPVKLGPALGRKLERN